MTTLTRTVKRQTVSTLDGSFGADRNRSLCVALNRGDVLVLWPKGTRQKETIHLLDVYRHAIRCRTNSAQLDKARKKKERKAERLAEQRQRRADRKLILPL